MKLSSLVKKINGSYRHLGQVVGAAKFAPSETQGRVTLFALGIALLAVGLSVDASALATDYNDDRISNSVNAILTYLEGSFGALVMVTAGIAAILSSAFGQYRAALGALVVAVGAYILRSFMSTFFNDNNIQQ